jgi:hypothetical protein
MKLFKKVTLLFPLRLGVLSHYKFTHRMEVLKSLDFIYDTELKFPHRRDSGGKQGPSPLKLMQHWNNKTFPDNAKIYFKNYTTIQVFLAKFSV